MSITEQMKKDVVVALKAHDKERVSALRMILSQLQMGAKEAAAGFGEEQELKILATEKKKRLQAAEGFRAGGREEGAAREEAEAGMIDTYLPRAMSDDDLAKLVDDVVEATGALDIKDMGKVMSRLMPLLAGRADGNVASAMVKERLTAG
ncbi:MAG: GatB/YqeY domain-containing protein [Thermoleophilia bacterium]